MLSSLLSLLFALQHLLLIGSVQERSDISARVPNPSTAQQQEQQEEVVFSGPQPGETLPELIMNGVYDELAGQSINVNEKFENKPALLIFVHERSRPAFAMMNTLTRFSDSRKEKGLSSATCFLSADPTDTENWLKIVRQYLPESKERLIGISPDGQEGPGAFGLNRNVAMTILVINEGKVTSNFALVQPSLTFDGPKIFQALVDVTGGGDVPEVTDFAGAGEMNRSAGRNAGGNTGGRNASANEQDPRLRPLLTKLIRKDASDADVDRAAEAVQKFVMENPDTKPQIAAIANRIIQAGKLQDYGTPHAQKYLKEWSTKFAEPAPAPEKPAVAEKPAVPEKSTEGQPGQDR